MTAGLMFVKICGLTTIEDARRACDLGASAVGFLFWPKSPRFITPATARAIVRELPAAVRKVGVFVNQPLAEVNRVAEEVGLTTVQLHGDEPSSYCAAVERPVIKVLALGPSSSVADADGVPALAMLLVDRGDAARRGGTGTCVDWNLAAQIARRRPTILAGGLNPENVCAAIGAVQPYGIDVSSGVESAPGIKDSQRMEALFRRIDDLRV